MFKQLTAHLQYSTSDPMDTTIYSTGHSITTTAYTCNCIYMEWYQVTAEVAAKAKLSPACWL